MSPTANGDVVAGEAAGHRVRPGGPVVLRRLRRLGTLPAALLGAPALDGLAAPRLVGLGEPGRADDAIVAALDRHVSDTAAPSDVGRPLATAPLARPRPLSPPPTPTGERASLATAPLPRLRPPLPPAKTPRPSPPFDTSSTARRAGAEPSGPDVSRAAPPFAADAPTAGSAPTDVIAAREPRGSRLPEPALARSPLAAIGAATPPCPPERETMTPALRRALGADATGPGATSRPRPIASGSRRAASPWRVDAAAAAPQAPAAALATLTPPPAATTVPPVVNPSGPAPDPVEPARVRGLHGLVEAWNGGGETAGSGGAAVEASTSAATPTSGSTHEPREITASGSDLDAIVAFGAALEVVLAGEAARHGIEVAR